MPYLRFKIAEVASAVATVASSAKVSAIPGEMWTVASVAGVDRNSDIQP
jgi:hypothetical protein